MTEAGISTSHFYLWRTLFALAHADGVVSEEEIEFLSDNTGGLGLSPAQHEILRKDLIEEQDPAAMFTQVTDGKDREEFFALARVLCWSDGDYDLQEKRVMELLSDIQADQEAQALLKRSRATVQAIHEIQDVEEEGVIASFFKRLLKRD